MSNKFFREVMKRIFLKQNTQQFGAFPPGHYYSPIPDRTDVLRYIDLKPKGTKELVGIDLNERAQIQLVDKFSTFYDEIEIPAEKHPSYRYYFNNDWFSYADGIILQCFLRTFRPRRILEIGSGFSSALMLDTVDRHFDLRRPEITLVEPNPERLLLQIREDDLTQVRLIEEKVQDIDETLFLDLSSNDLLFIDSSHVVKCGSDLQFILFEIVPKLNDGVFVHFHDVFYPFEYPDEWLAEGRYWNENYFLRSFLSFNSEWKICFFNSYINLVRQELIQEKMPLCLNNPGGSLYLRKGVQDPSRTLS